MTLARRKLVTIVTETALEKTIVEQLDGLGAGGFTITDARGKGTHGPRESDWGHGANIRIEVVCNESTATAICDAFKNHYSKNYAMILFLSDVEVFRAEKF